MATERWEIDSSHSGIHFSVRHLVIAKVRGQFSRWSGARRRARRRLHPGHRRRGDRRLEHRDRRGRPRRPPQVGGLLRRRAVPGADVQDRRGSSRTGDDLTLVGELTIKGITREVALQVEQLGQLKDPWGNQRAAFSAKTAIDRKDFGLAWNQVLETGGAGRGRARQHRDRARGRASGRREGRLTTGGRLALHGTRTSSNRPGIVFGVDPGSFRGNDRKYSISGRSSVSSGPSPAKALSVSGPVRYKRRHRRQIPVEHRPEGRVLPPLLEAAGAELEGRQAAGQQRSFGPEPWCPETPTGTCATAAGTRSRCRRQSTASRHPPAPAPVAPARSTPWSRQRPIRHGWDDQIGRHDVVLPARGQQEVARVVDPHVHVRSRQQVEVDGAEERRGANHVGRQLDDVHLRAGKARRCSSGGPAPQARRPAPAAGRGAASSAARRCGGA